MGAAGGHGQVVLGLVGLVAGEAGAGAQVFGCAQQTGGAVGVAGAGQQPGQAFQRFSQATLRAEIPIQGQRLAVACAGGAW